MESGQEVSNNDPFAPQPNLVVNDDGVPQIADLTNIVNPDDHMDVGDGLPHDLDGCNDLAVREESLNAREFALKAKETAAIAKEAENLKKKELKQKAAQVKMSNKQALSEFSKKELETELGAVGVIILGDEERLAECAAINARLTTYMEHSNLKRIKIDALASQIKSLKLEKTALTLDIASLKVQLRQKQEAVAVLRTVSDGRVDETVSHGDETV